jgi:hypothetical protein
MEKYKIVEKNNFLAIHGLFYSKAQAEYHLTHNIPVYVKKGYFSNKTLTAKDFIIVER